MTMSGEGQSAQCGILHGRVTLRSPPAFSDYPFKSNVTSSRAGSWHGGMIRMARVASRRKGNPRDPQQQITLGFSITRQTGSHVRMALGKSAAPSKAFSAGRALA